MKQTLKVDRPRVFLSGPVRYAVNAAEMIEKYQAECEEQGFELIYPTLEDLSKVEGTPEEAEKIFNRITQKIKACDIWVGHIDPFRDGQEPEGNMSFECGYAWANKKDLYCYINDMRTCKERYNGEVVQTETGGWRDKDGLSIEDGVANLMLTGPSIVIQGEFCDALKRAKIEKLRKEGR